MTQILTPADVVLMRFGGSKDRIAEVIGKHRTTVAQWWHDKPNRRRGDIPTPDAQRKLLRYARAHGIPLTAEELIFGASLEIKPLDEIPSPLRAAE